MDSVDHRLLDLSFTVRFRSTAEQIADYSRPRERRQSGMSNLGLPTVSGNRRLATGNVNVFAAPPIKYFKILFTLSIPNPNPNLKP